VSVLTEISADLDFNQPTCILDFQLDDIWFLAIDDESEQAVDDSGDYAYANE